MGRNLWSDHEIISKRGMRKLKSSIYDLVTVRLFTTPWAVAYQGPLSMGFSRQEYWSGLPFPSPRPSIRPRIGKYERELMGEKMVERALALS